MDQDLDIPGQMTESPEGPDAVSVGAETAVLGACLMATPRLDPVPGIARILADGGDWYRPHHETVWRAILALHGRSKPTGVPMVEAELRRTGDLTRVGGFLGLSQIAAQACPAVEVEHYAEIVHGYARLRRLQQALARGMQMTRQADPAGVPDTIAGLQAELEHLSADQTADDGLYGRFGDGLQDHLDGLETVTEAAAVSGFTDLDQVLKLRAGNLVIVAGRPAMGKSAMTLGVALANAATGRTTLVHSIEMGREEVTNRILANRSRVALHHLMEGGPSVNDDDWTRIARAMPDLTTLPLWVDYTPRVTPGLVRTRIKALIRETGQPPLVIIDYVQLMYTDQRNSRQTPYERVSEVSRELKIIAEETGAVIICCAQLNRGSEHREGKKPQTADLRDSGQLEQDASGIILLHREDAYEPESSRAGESDLILSKNRNGPTCTITVAHQFHYSRLRDMSRDSDPTT
ncbi:MULTISPECIES: replicative DNA helicase [unclassified Streptomyces]|uniref:replicative DNA helicase n=1 Tax=unclassified Streptomyces TaxID=2593676 RepID=UPI001F17F390|nr:MULTISPECIES: DnaB-like helicase C-terminal domain-containing protein [unclassified Streptomyces]